jgi:hypothetical protein
MIFFSRIFLLITFLYAPTSLWGTMALPLNLSQMTEQAGTVFVGRCLESSPELDENRMPATLTRFEVLNGIKGVSTGEKILIKTYGVAKEPLDVREGEKAIVPLKSMTLSGGGFRPNEEYLLFLYPESRLGFTSPVGGGQGKFEILTGRQGEKLVLNPFGNHFLKEFPASGRPIQLEKAIETVQKLVVHE